MTINEQQTMWYLLLTSLILNSTALQLLACKATFRYRRWGYIIGIAAQPYWLVMFLKSENDLMLFIASVNTVAWFRGIYNYWISPSNDS